MPDYQQAKVYKIVSSNTNQVYIGSTCKKLNHRLNSHIHDLNRNSSCTSKEILVHGDYQIVLLEDYPCNTKDELNIREQYYKDLHKDICVNKLNPGNKWTKEVEKQYNKEYREKNWDKIKEQRQNNDDYKEYQKTYSKEYREKNKDDLVVKRKEYCEKHKDEISDYYKKYCDDHPELLDKKKQYYDQNKVAILEKQKETMTCECGSTCRKSDYKRHCKSKKHTSFIANK